MAPPTKRVHVKLHTALPASSSCRDLGTAGTHHGMERFLINLCAYTQLLLHRPQQLPWTNIRPPGLRSTSTRRRGLVSNIFCYQPIPLRPSWPPTAQLGYCQYQVLQPYAPFTLVVELTLTIADKHTPREIILFKSAHILTHSGREHPQDNLPITY
ncbi:hypothetical protein B0T25DRAFT_239533 [Lasiosphaeria hispida]|uniref:Uncharacterized protein n=1 Tax=Lasiosphaeria hispida TaxID=260671 RepID=A0AAJ0HET2_9PEZI|nr:hypothetical protein B0T25DRAFT_239533 [Lasiosphaeria hispida]